jgi:hypothetical protein
MRNPVDEGHPQVIMAKRYLDEVKNASETLLSFPLYSIQVGFAADVEVKAG